MLCRIMAAAVSDPTPPNPQTIQLPFGPAAGEPVVNDPIDGVDLGTYAKIAAELAEAGAARAAILRACGLDELRWGVIERGFLVRIATAALRGDPSLALELDELYVRAQESLGPTDPTRSLDRYAWLVARLELGHDAAALFAADGLSLADWSRLHRAWTKRLVADPALAVTFREWVAQVKAQLNSGG
jgi:hypothetical protein